MLSAPLGALVSHETVSPRQAFHLGIPLVSLAGAIEAGVTCALLEVAIQKTTSDPS